MEKLSLVPKLCLGTHLRETPFRETGNSPDVPRGSRNRVAQTSVTKQSLGTRENQSWTISPARGPLAQARGSDWPGLPTVVECGVGHRFGSAAKAVTDTALQNGAVTPRAKPDDL